VQIKQQFLFISVYNDKTDLPDGILCIYKTFCNKIFPKKHKILHLLAVLITFLHKSLPVFGRKHLRSRSAAVWRQYRTVAKVSAMKISV